MTICVKGAGNFMTQEILKRLVGGALPMQFFAPRDIEDLQVLRGAGYLEVSFGPLEQSHQAFAMVTGVTPLGRAAIRYFGYGTRH